MSIMRKIKRNKNELIETYKNNYQKAMESRKEYYDKNIELQKKIIEQDNIITQLKKENRILKGKVTKATNKLKAQEKIEIAPSVENGNKIIEEVFKNE